MIFRIINETVKGNCLKEILNLPMNSFMVEIKEIRRSNNANALYWKWCSIIGNELGYDKDELHEAFKRKFIGEDQGTDLFGNIYKRPKSSADLKKKEFCDYMSKVQAFAFSNGITLPTPDYYGIEK